MIGRNAEYARCWQIGGEHLGDQRERSLCWMSSEVQSAQGLLKTWEVGGVVEDHTGFPR